MKIKSLPVNSKTSLFIFPNLSWNIRIIQQHHLPMVCFFNYQWENKNVSNNRFPIHQIRDQFVHHVHIIHYLTTYKSTSHRLGRYILKSNQSEFKFWQNTRRKIQKLILSSTIFMINYLHPRIVPKGNVIVGIVVSFLWDMEPSSYYDTTLIWDT